MLLVESTWVKKICNVFHSSFFLLFSDEDTPMVLPGEHTKVYLTLLWKMVMTEGQSFTIRENNRTVATGVVTGTLPSVEISHSLGKVEL